MRCEFAPVKPVRTRCRIHCVLASSEDRTMKRVLLFAALIAWSGMAGAVVYKWVDAQGKLQYGDRPPGGGHGEVVKRGGAPGGRAAPAPAAPSNTFGGDQASQDGAAKKAVQQDV